MDSSIYLDYAAGAPLRAEALEAMLPFLREEYGNPSALYDRGRRVRRSIERCRASIARGIGAEPSEIVFTSGGTESDNQALRGAVQLARRKTGRERVHLIVSAIEHPAVRNTARALEAEGIAEVTVIPVDERGLVDPGQVEAAIRPDTALISVLFASNEIGTLEPIAEIGRIARAHGVLLHTDAVQALGQVPLDVRELQVDLLSASGHKLGGPRGMGLLYVRRGVPLPPLLFGGPQERGLRAGTENAAGIAGLARALELDLQELGETEERERELRDHLIRRILSEIPLARLNGDPRQRLPGNVNVTLPFADAGALLLALGRRGICASAGSACAAGDPAPSPVLRAIGRSHEEALSSIRLTLGRESTLQEVDRAADVLVQEVERLRERSAGWRESKKSRS